jgi:hypothetical protein
MFDVRCESRKTQQLQQFARRIVQWKKIVSSKPKKEQSMRDVAATSCT